MKRRIFLGSAAAISCAGFSSLARGQQKIVWRMQSVDAASTMEYKDLVQAFANRVREASGGRLEIRAQPAGALMKSNEVPDAVGKGALDIANTFSVYMSGKEPALKAANEWPAQVDPLQGVKWVYEGGGLALMREIVDKHGIFFLGSSPLSGEHIWSKRSLAGVQDLKGLKMRAAGLAADSFRRLGAAVVSMPGEEVYQGLQRGIIDAAEFTTLSVNYNMGLHEVAKYLIVPTYSGGGSYDWIVNKKKWNETPPELRKVAETALAETAREYWVKAQADERRLTGELKKKGMQFIEWPVKDMKALELSRIGVMREQYAKDSALYARKLQSQLAFLKQLGYQVPQ